MIRENRKRRPRPSLRASLRPWLRRVVVPAVLLGLGSGGAWMLNERLRISDWRIDAPAAVKPDIDSRVRAWLQTHNDFWHTQPFHLRRILLDGIPDLADVSIQRSLKGSLNIRAEMRQPVVLWQNGREVWLVDHEGRPYRALRKGEWPDLPLLRLTRDEIGEALRLLAALQHVAPSRLTRLSEIHGGTGYWKLIMSRGEMWLLPKQGVEDRLARLVTILQQPRWKHRHFRVDARDEHRWYLRTAKHEGVI